MGLCIAKHRCSQGLLRHVYEPASRDGERPYPSPRIGFSLRQRPFTNLKSTWDEVTVAVTETGEACQSCHTPSEAISSVAGYLPSEVSHLTRQSCGELEVLRRQMEELRGIIEAQQDLLVKQQESITQLEAALKSSQPSPGGSVKWTSRLTPFEAQRVAIGDRRYLGLFDARFHSTSSMATPKDLRVLPERIILVRHAESEGNVDNMAYTYIPDPQVPLTDTGVRQARAAGAKIRRHLDQQCSPDYKLYFYISPYKRSLQTFENIVQSFTRNQLLGVQEEVQLREQDFGNFQDAEGKKREKAERMRYGRFFYRFPNGESGADVYDRITIFEDHLIRDINAGRFSADSSLVLVTHGLALRIFLMRWFHWTVEQFLDVYNPPNAEPLIMERVTTHAPWTHTKALYKLSEDSMAILQGCTSDMCSTFSLPPGSKNMGVNSISKNLI